MYNQVVLPSLPCINGGDKRNMKITNSFRNKISQKNQKRNKDRDSEMKLKKTNKTRKFNNYNRK